MSELECGSCHECCKQPGFVYLTEDDTDRLAKSLSVDIYTFTNWYCELQDRERLVLKKFEDESCVFLTSGCSVYQSRPQQCRDFPGRWRTPRSETYCKFVSAEINDKIDPDLKG